MAQFRSIPIGVLAERLGPTFTRRVYGSDTAGHVSWLVWACNGEENIYDSCRAINRASDYDDFPNEGWELTTCSRHGETFSDFPSG